MLALAARRAARGARALATQTVFSPARKLAQRERAAARPDAADFDYVRAEVAARLVERLGDITRSFGDVLDLGAGTGATLHALLAARAGGGGGGDDARGPRSVRAVTLLDPSARVLSRDAAAQDAAAAAAGVSVSRRAAPLDGAALPFADASFDLVLSSMALHWVNDVPGLLAEARRVLRPDGAFMAAFVGGETLQELRAAAVAAEHERDGGVSPRVSPMMGASDAGNLLAGAGFGLPTVDVDTFTLEYPTAAALFEHLRAAGESGAALGARAGARRDTLLATAAAYTAAHGDADGAVPATVQVIFMIGWAPAASQPRAKARGSVPKGFSERKTALPPSSL